MSGGVDSSVAAALLVDAGYDVTGIMLKLWRGEAANHDSGCCNLGAAEDARRVADTLGIPFYVFNLADEFEQTVIRNFHEEYAAGRTPNPCVRCNQWVKFGTLLDKARALGANVLATGHYARVQASDGGFRLLRGVDRSKDQSYVLWMLSQRELEYCRFPVGEMAKSETRALAAQLGLRTAAKPDSQEICFVRGGDVGTYVREQIPQASIPGPLVDGSGNVLGEHRGIGRYTVGQRKGLGIALGTPVFVRHLDASSNTVVVGGRDELSVVGFVADEASFVADAQEGDVLVQHRAHGETNPARLRMLDASRVEVTFVDPVAALAPGQSAAFYSAREPDVLVGGAVIAATVPVPALV